jgi:hypothetical protein
MTPLCRDLKAAPAPITDTLTLHGAHPAAAKLRNSRLSAQAA